MFNFHQRRLGCYGVVPFQLSTFGINSESNPITSTPTTQQGPQTEGNQNQTPTTQLGAYSTAPGANQSDSITTAGTSHLGNGAVSGHDNVSITSIQSLDPAVAGDAIAGVSSVAQAGLAGNALVASQAEQDVSALSAHALDDYAANSAANTAALLSSTNNAIGAVAATTGNAFTFANNTTLASLAEAHDANANADAIVAHSNDNEADLASASLNLAGNIAGNVSEAISNGNATADSLLEELTSQYASGLSQATSNAQIVASNAQTAEENTLTAGVAPSQNLQSINASDPSVEATPGISGNWQKLAFWAGLAATGFALYYYVVKKKAV